MAKVATLNWTHYAFLIQTGTDPATQAPIFTEIAGIKSGTLNADKEDADTTDFDSEGNAEHQVAQRSYSLECDGQVKRDNVTGARDAGQVAVNAHAKKVGHESLTLVRMAGLQPGMETIQGLASANVTGVGGAKNDPTAWNPTFTFSGGLTEVAA